MKLRYVVLIAGLTMWQAYTSILLTEARHEINSLREDSDDHDGTIEGMSDDIDKLLAGKTPQVVRMDSF